MDAQVAKILFQMKACRCRGVYGKSGGTSSVGVKGDEDTDVLLLRTNKLDGSKYRRINIARRR